MKKVLLGTSALVAAGLVLGSAATASAQSKEGPIQVSIGGYFYGYLAGMSQNDSAKSGIYTTNQPGNGVENFGVFRKSRLQFNGRTDLDNGAKVGFRIELRGESQASDQIDKSYLFFDTALGRVELGKTRGAGFNMQYNNPNIQEALSDPWNLNYGDFNGMKAPSANVLAGGGNTWIGNNRSEGITYYTPRFSGFQLGLTYQPDGCDIAAPSLNQTQGSQAVNTMQGSVTALATNACGGGIGNGFMNSNNIGQQSQVWQIGANYVNKLGGVDLAISAGYAGGSVEQNATNTLGQQTFKGESQWVIGANIGYAGFLLGGAYQQDNLGVKAANATYGIATGLAGNNAVIMGNNANNWTLGLAYQYERWRVGINYIAGSASDVNLAGTSLGNDKYQGWEIGGGYTMGPGITLSAGIEWQKWTSGTFNASNPLYNSAVNSGTVYQLGTVLRF